MASQDDRRSTTQAQLESAQDAFVIALRRLRALESLAAELKGPLDLEHAHELWRRVTSAPPRALQPPNKSVARLEGELEIARSEFRAAREALRIAEAAAAAAVRAA